MTSAIIVDDEVHQQELLSNMLTTFPDVEIKHICSSVDEGIAKIAEHQPDLVFLDVMLPPKTGFDLLSSVSTINFDIIFTTSYEQFALQALKLSAVDYLLKPYGISDLTSALHKFETKKELKQSLNHIQTLLHNVNNNTSGLTKIALPTMKGFVFVVINTIIRCEADNVYTTIYFTDNSTVVISRSIKECEQLLSHYNFFRAHNSHLINMQHVKEYIKGDGGTIKMADGSTVDLSRLRKEDFIEKLNRI